MMNLNFNINTIFLGLIGVFISYTIVGYYLTAVDVYKPQIGNLPVPIQVGKSKVYVSKDRDASMSTEIIRRRTIIGSNSCAIHPKFGYSGSTNGSLETFFISGLCPTFIKEKVFVFDSIENVLSNIFGESITNPTTTTENAPILDGGGSNIDDKQSVFINPGGANTDYSNAKTIDFGGAR